MYPTSKNNSLPKKSLHHLRNGKLRPEQRPRRLHKRMDVTGARWSVDGAEAVLKVRALRSNGDFDAYWRWHRSRERQRVHDARYRENVVPAAA